MPTIIFSTKKKAQDWAKVMRAKGYIAIVPSQRIQEYGWAVSYYKREK